MTRKIYSVVCKCWNTVFCACKDVLVRPQPYENTIEYWKHIEGVDEYLKKYLRR